jgi:hypothetical protein
MVKRTVVWIIVVMFFAGITPIFAKDGGGKVPNPNEKAYEHANENARFKRTGDVKGKEAEKVKERSVKEAEKAKKEVEKKAEKEKKEAEKKIEKAKRVAEKEAKKKQKEMEKEARKVEEGLNK